MVQLKRLQPLLLAVLLAAAPLSNVVAQELLSGFGSPSSSGSFLAGQQAFKDLRTGKASSFFLDALETEWENPAIVERAFVALIADGKVDDAAAMAPHLIDLDPQNTMARLVLGAVAIKERRYTSALKQLEDADFVGFVGYTATLVRAWALVGDKKYSEANAALDAISNEGLETFLVFHRALMADVAGEREIAIDYSTQTLLTDPYDPRIIEMHTRMLANSSLFAEAKEILDDFEAQGLSHPLVDVVADAVAEKRRPGKMAANVQAGTGEMFFNFGSALAREGSRDIAVVYLRLALYLEPESDIVSMTLGQLLEQAGRFGTANKLYNKVPRNSPLKATAMVRIAENFDADGNREEAIRRLGNIVATQPENLDAVSILGDLQRYDEAYEDAIVSYTKALDIAGGERPADWRFYYVRGIANERADHWEDAEADFLKALDLNPGHPLILNYLGYSWVDKGMNLHRALEMIRDAVQVNPTDGYTVDSLGWAYYRLDRIDEAVQSLEQAVQLRPNDPEINDHLGDAYWKAGRKLEAHFQWSVVVDVDEDGEIGARAKAKLEDGLVDDSAH